MRMVSAMGDAFQGADGGMGGGETQERSFAAQADAFAGRERGGKGVGLFRSG